MNDDSGGAVYLLILVGIYFFPGIVAEVRRHRQRLTIGMSNLLLGWTVLGWIFALIWACSSDVEGSDGRDLVDGLHDPFWGSSRR